MVDEELVQRKIKARAAIGLESYAEILAHVFHFQAAEKADVLRRFGLSEEEFTLLDSAWMDELALGMKRQQRDQALRFSSALAKHRKRLLGQMPALESIGRPVSMVSDEPPIQTEIKTNTIEALPIFRPMRNASLDSIEGSVSPWIVHAAAPVAPVIAQPPPSPAPPAPALPLAPQVPLQVPGQGQTADISAFVPRDLLPFQPAPSAPSMPAVTPAVPAVTPAAPPAEMPAPPERNGKRLIRFNPQTGQMLEQPIWVDVPEK